MLRLLRVRKNGGSHSSPSYILPEQVQEVVREGVSDSEVIALCERRDTLNDERERQRSGSYSRRSQFPGRYTVVDEEGVEIEL